MKILVTGAAGQLARAVLPRLCADRAIDRIIALDRQRIHFLDPKIESLHADLRTVGLEPLLHGCDALVHLAWTVLRGRTSAQAMHANNVGVSQKLFTAAAQTGVTRLVHVSSAAVYGVAITKKPVAPIDCFGICIANALITGEGGHQH